MTCVSEPTYSQGNRVKDYGPPRPHPEALAKRASKDEGEEESGAEAFPRPSRPAAPAPQDEETGMSRLMLKSGNRRRWRELYAAFAV